MLWKIPTKLSLPLRDSDRLLDWFLIERCRIQNRVHIQEEFKRASSYWGYLAQHNRWREPLEHVFLPNLAAAKKPSQKLDHLSTSDVTYQV